MLGGAARGRAGVLCIALLASLAVAAQATAAGRCGAHPWCDTSLSPDARASLLLGALTRDEKISLLAGDELTGVAGGEGQHTGTSDGVPRVDLPTTYFSDGPVGPRQGKATGMPSPMSVAASFDPGNAFRHAGVVGDEVRRKGNDVVYAPATNMLRTPLNGRTFEYFGEDPHLSAEITKAWTRGVQAEGVIANVKHYAVNNQEGQGVYAPFAPLGAGVIGPRLTIDARLDERTLREIYLRQFEAAVTEAGAGSVMCAYNRVNGDYACENEHLLEDILKGDWGFDGFVLTDYGAAKSTAPSLRDGLDLDIWPGVAYDPANVNAALASGQVTEATIDEHVGRILRTLFAFGFFDRDAYVDDTSSIDASAHNAIAGEVEEQGIVLLRNETGLLPLNAGSISELALIGPEADLNKDGGGSSAIDEFQLTTPRDAIESRLGAEQVSYDDGSDPERAAAVAAAADVAVVVVGDNMGEGADKPCMGLNCGQNDQIDRDQLVEAVAAAQPQTAVVLQSGGPVLTPWRERILALVEAWFPGQNGGTAIARVLFGDAEPGGRLPGTFPLREADEPTAGDPEKYPGVAETAQYKEGVLIGYRWFDEKGLGVAYPFGHGLSYTTFAYDQLRIDTDGDAPTVTARVSNTGARTGSEVPQLYLRLPDPAPEITQPPRQLKGFDKVTLAPGETRTVTFALDRRDLSYWSVAANDWQVAPGCYGVEVGASSRDIRLSATFGIDATCAAAVEPRTRIRLTTRCTRRGVRVAVRGPNVGRVRRVAFRGERGGRRRDAARPFQRMLPARRFKGRRWTVRAGARLRGGRLVRLRRGRRACARASQLGGGVRGRRRVPRFTG